MACKPHHPKRRTIGACIITDDSSVQERRLIIWDISRLHTRVFMRRWSSDMMITLSGLKVYLRRIAPSFDSVEWSRRTGMRHNSIRDAIDNHHDDSERNAWSIRPYCQHKPHCLTRCRDNVCSESVLIRASDHLTEKKNRLNGQLIGQVMFGLFQFVCIRYNEWLLHQLQTNGLSSLCRLWTLETRL